MQAQPPPVQVVTQVQYVQGPSFGHRAVTMVCPHCQNNITTRTSSEPSALAWIIGGVLCFVGAWPCACIPCCIDSLNQVCILFIKQLWITLNILQFELLFWRRI